MSKFFTTPSDKLTIKKSSTPSTQPTRNFFNMSDDGSDSVLEYKTSKKQQKDYDYSDLDSESKKVGVGTAFKLGLLDTTRGLSQITGKGFDQKEMAREQKQLVKAMQGENGNLVKVAYFAGAILDPASWLIPFGKAKTLYTMGKYGMVSGAIAGAAGYVDEEQDSIIGSGKITRGEQAGLSAIGGGVLAPTFGALRNLGIKVTGSKKAITPIGQPDPEGFIGTIFNLKHVNPKKAYVNGMTKVQLEGKAKTVEGVKEGDKVVIAKEKKRTVFERPDEKIGDPSSDIQKTVVKDDLDLVRKNLPRKGMYLGGPKSFFNKYIAQPYQEKIGRPTFQKLATGQGATSAAGGLYGFNVDDEAPIISFTDPFSSRLGRAVTGAVFGLLGFRALTRESFGFGPERLKKVKPGTEQDAGKEISMTWTEFLGRQFIDKYNLPREFTKLRQQAQGLGGTIADQFADLVKKAKLLNMDERKILYNMLEGEELVKVESSKIKNLSKEARDIITKYGQMYHDFGLLDKDVFQKNINSYLRRVYDNVDDIPKIGDDLKPRGIVKKVTDDEYNKIYKNEKAFNEDGTPVMIRGGKDEPTMVPHRGWEIFDEVTEDGIKKKVIRWEYTKAQRLAKHEIEDAAAAIELTGQYMASTISQYKFYDDIFKTPKLTAYVKDGDNYVLDKKFKGLSEDEMNKSGYYKMPDTNITDTKTKRYGSLSGKYVLKEVYLNLLNANKYRETSGKDFYKYYQKLNRLWKVSKTAWNPTVHVNNIFGNIFFSDMGDIPLFVGTGKGGGLINSFKLLAEHNSSKPTKSSVVYLAQKFGVFDADFIARELKTFDFKAVKDAYRYDATKTEWRNATDIAGRVYQAVRKNKITGTLENWYRVEDHIFRLNAFIHKMQQGYSASDAAMFARKQFIDYDIDAPVINHLRNSATPFLAFTYRVIPLLAETAVVRPWKYAKYAALGYGLNKIGETMGGGDAEVERQLLPKDRAGNILGIPILPNNEIKLPFKGKDGASKYINVKRLFPGGDTLELGEGIIPGLPAPLQPSFGIGGDILFGLAGVDLFRKKMDDTHLGHANAVQNLKGAITRIATKLIPNFPFLPGSYSTARINRSRPGVENVSAFSVKEPEWQAILNAFGIKITDRTLDTLTVGKEKEFTNIIKKLEEQIRDEEKKLLADKITMQEFDEKVAEIAIEMQKQAMIFGGRLEGISPAEIVESEAVLNLRNNR